MFKKFLISLFIGLFIFLSTPATYVSAQGNVGPWYNQGLFDWYMRVYDESTPPSEIFGERYTAAQVDWIIYSIITWLPTKLLKPEFTACLIGVVLEGTVMDDCFTALTGNNPAPENPAYAQLPPDQQPSLLASFTEDRPLSAITYFKTTAKKFLPAQEVQAQGFGYTTGLNPVLFFWRAVRDVVYFFFVIIAIVLAFMVMFRAKIAPQVVITAQSAIFKLAIALLLVTFSFAIAGLLVDLMYFVIGLFSLMASMATGISAPVLFNFMIKGQPTAVNFSFGVVGLFFVYLLLFAITFVVVILSTLGAILSAITAMITAIAFAALTVLSGGIVPLIAAILFFILFAVVLVMLLIMIIKIMWSLIKAFANVLLLTIFSPVYILIGVFYPAFSFGTWVRSMVSNLAVFVVTSGLFLMAFLFLFFAVENVISQYMGGGIGNAFLNYFFGTGLAGIVQGDITAGWPPLLWSGDSTVAFVYLIVSLVLFMMTPKASEMIKGAISGKPFLYGTAIGEAVVPLAWAGGQAVGGARAGGSALLRGSVLPHIQMAIQQRGARVVSQAETRPTTGTTGQVSQIKRDAPKG